MDRCNTWIAPFFRVINCLLTCWFFPQSALIQERIDDDDGLRISNVVIGNRVTIKRVYTIWESSMGLNCVLTEFINGTANANGCQAMYFLVDQSSHSCCIKHNPYHPRQQPWSLDFSSGCWTMIVCGGGLRYHQWSCHSKKKSIHHLRWLIITTIWRWSIIQRLLTTFRCRRGIIRRHADDRKR